MRLAALLLAAGEGRRFGGCKQLAELDEKPLIRHALDALLPLFNDSLYVVLGAHRDRVRAVIEPPAKIVEHAQWQAGMGSSIACGIGAIENIDAVDGLLIALADQPRITQADYHRLSQSFEGDRIVATEYNGQPGAPAIFPQFRFEDLAALEGDRGARQLLRDPNTETQLVIIASAGFDVDQKADLESN